MERPTDEDCPCPCAADAGPARPASRREFLHSVAAVVTLLGLAPTRANALPVLLTEGMQAGGELRYPIPPSDSVNVDRAAQVIVTRLDRRVYVFALSCPHQNAAVKWMPKDHRFQCTKHDSQYQPDGVHTSGRATRNLDRYVISRDGDVVVVDLHHWIQSDKDPAGWAAAGLTV
jgi:Rieske Fe-S protein